MAKSKLKKRFLDSIGAALRENVVEEIVIERKILPKKKLGFLDQIAGDALDADALGEVMPKRDILNKKKSLISNLDRFSGDTGLDLVIPVAKRAVKSVDYSTEIYTELLEKLRDIATFRKISINEAFNNALKQYVDKYWDVSMMSEE